MSVVHQLFLYWREEPAEQSKHPGSATVGSGFHGAKRHHDDQDHSAGGCGNQSSNLTQLGPPKLRLFSLQQWVIAWRVNVLHPIVQVVGVQGLLGLRNQERESDSVSRFWSHGPDIKNYFSSVLYFSSSSSTQNNTVDSLWWSVEIQFAKISLIRLVKNFERK